MIFSGFSRLVRMCVYECIHDSLVSSLLAEIAESGNPRSDNSGKGVIKTCTYIYILCVCVFFFDQLSIKPYTSITSLLKPNSNSPRNLPVPLVSAMAAMAVMQLSSRFEPMARGQLWSGQDRSDWKLRKRDASSLFGGTTCAYGAAPWWKSLFFLAVFQVEDHVQLMGSELAGEGLRKIYGGNMKHCIYTNLADELCFIKLSFF